MSEKARTIPEEFHDIHHGDNLRDSLFRLPVEDGGDKPMRLAERGEDPETEAEICAYFKRNIRGYVSFISQYKQQYVTYRYVCPAQIEEALGTEKARIAMRKMVTDAIEPFKGAVAVWRKWPRINRSDGLLHLSMRFHLMIEADLEAFYPSE